MISVLAPGSWVLIGDDVPATINQVCIESGGTISYEVVWWSDRDRKVAWVFEHEVRPHNQPGYVEIGFRH
jgi:hypothetical protein